MPPASDPGIAGRCERAGPRAPGSPVPPSDRSMTPCRLSVSIGADPRGGRSPSAEGRGPMEGQLATNLSLEQMDVETTLHAFTPIHEHEKTGPHIITKGDGIYVTDNKGQYLHRLHGLALLRQRGIRTERDRRGDCRAGPELPLLPHHGGPCQRAADQAERPADGPAAGLHEPASLRELGLGGERTPTSSSPGCISAAAASPRSAR